MLLHEMKDPYGHCLSCGSDRRGLFFTLVPLIEKGKQRNNKATKGNQQSRYANENRYDFKSRHKRHLLPMYSGKPV